MKSPQMSASISKSIVWVGFPWEEASLKLLKGQRLLDRLTAALERGEPGGSR
jgi:hypothetical protein